jgi:histidyl-tRNA synthetase
LEFLRHKKISYAEVTGGSAGREVLFDQVEVEKALRYSCEDAHATLLLTQLLGKKLEEEGLSRLFHEVEIPLIEVLLEMEFRGIRIDTAFFESLAQEFRAGGVWVEMSGEDKSLKSQMRRADKLGAARVLVLGESELAAGTASLKDMLGGGQTPVSLSDLGRALFPRRCNQ